MLRIKEIVVVFVILLGLPAVLMVLPCSCHDPRDLDADERYWFRHNMGRIVCAMHDYHDEHRRFPPPVVYGKDGKPLYSWRVLLLRYLEWSDDTKSIYKQFKLDEPWDSPHNKTLLKWTPWSYAQGAEPGFTNCQLLVGPGTAFEKPGLNLKEDFPDGLANTIFVVEAKTPVPWSKPVDLTYDPNGPLPEFGGHFSYQHRFLHCRYGSIPGFFASFGDASRAFIPSNTDERIIRALITRNGGEKETIEDWKR